MYHVERWPCCWIENADELKDMENVCGEGKSLGANVVGEVRLAIGLSEKDECVKDLEEYYAMCGIPKTWYANF